jgi:hypothetical protein
MSVSQHARSKKMVVYEAPSSPVAYAVWRVQMWAEATFALSMMESWEKVLICMFYSSQARRWSSVIDHRDTGAFIFSLTLLFLTGLIKYLPHHLHFVVRRSMYYLFGRELDPSEVLAHLSDAGKVVLDRGEL